MAGARAGLVANENGAKRGRWPLFLTGVGVGLATIAADSLYRRGRKLVGSPPKDSPAEIGARGWRDIVKRTVAESTEDRIPLVAAGSAFFALLALFPALGVFVSLYGLVGDLQKAQHQIAGFRGILPAGGITVLGDEIYRLSITSHATLGLTFFVSFVLSVWSANAGMKGVIGGLNVAYERPETRNFLKLNLLSLAFTAGAILFAVAAMAAIALAPDILARLHLQALAAASLLRWPALLVVAAGALSVLYRFAPCRHGARWRWITPGGVGAAVAWMAMSLGFSFYVNHFGRFDVTYGPLGAVVGFMTWIWLSLIIVLAGAEFNSELEQEAGERGAKD